MPEMTKYERDGKPIAGLATQMDQEKQMGVPPVLADPQGAMFAVITLAPQT